MNHQRQLVIAPNGKISLTKSLLNCPSCPQAQAQVIALREEIDRLKHRLIEKDRIEQQMVDLTKAVEETKLKLIIKLEERQKRMMMAFNPVLASENFRQEGATKTMAYREMSTDRSWNIPTDR